MMCECLFSVVDVWGGCVEYFVVCFSLFVLVDNVGVYLC